MQMHSDVGTAFCDEDSAISYTAFGQGSFVFDLTAHLSNAEHTEPTRCGSLWAKVHFGLWYKTGGMFMLNTATASKSTKTESRLITWFKEMDTFQIKNILSKNLGGSVFRGVYARG